MRLLAGVRLSLLKDATTSPETQRKSISEFAERGSHSIVAIAEDLDVSGAVAPQDRPELGPWLTDPDKINQWDCLIVAKLDRVSRSLLDFLLLGQWLKERGKTLLSLNPEIDLTTAAGRMHANNLMNFAEYERELIKERTATSYHHRAEKGQFTGGYPSFGYMPARNDVTKTWHYEIDPAYGPIVATMAEKYLAGSSLNQIALWLNSLGIPTSRNAEALRRGREAGESTWSSMRVGKVLGNPAIAGFATKDGDILRDGFGMPVVRCEGIVTRETYDKLKAQLEVNRAKTGPRINASLLVQIIFCKCGSPMYHQKITTKGKLYRYYKCNASKLNQGCNGRSVHAEAMEQLVIDSLLEKLGPLPMLRKEVTPAEDHARELVEVDRAITDLEQAVISGKMSVTMAGNIAPGLEARRNALEAIEAKPESVDWIPTGQTFSQHWEALQESERNVFLRTAGVKVHVGKIAAEPVLMAELSSDRIIELDFTGDDRIISLDLGDLRKLRELATAA